MTQLTPQHYLLSCLMEECGELIQASSKVFRFGWNSTKPKDKNFKSNLNDFITELADVVAVAEMLGFSILDKDIVDRVINKKLKVRRYLDEHFPEHEIKSNKIAEAIKHEH